MPERSAGDLAIVLHSHMPYVEGFGTYPFGEEWLFDAAIRSYLPVLEVAERLTMTVTPVLADQLEDPGARERLREFLVEWRVGAAEADLVVFSGGSSVGERDLILDALKEIGEVVFHGIAVKPGKPTVFGRVGGTPVFGMPGYPTSCLSNAYMLLVPALRRRGAVVRLLRPAAAGDAEVTPHGASSFGGWRWSDFSAKAPRPSCSPETESATSRSSPTSTTARPRWWTSCSARPASSVRTKRSSSA